MSGYPSSFEPGGSHAARPPADMEAMVGTGTTSTLRHAIERGEYVVDERKVAEAILRRASTVLVAAQALDLSPPRSGDDQTLACDDLA
jgi:hypothetical protein